MKKILLASVLAVTSVTVFAGDERKHDISYKPKVGYASTTGAAVVEPSAKNIISSGEQISRLTERNFNGDSIVQRLTERSYWMQVGFYNVVFYVGDKGVLLFDPLAYGSGKAVLTAIKSVTDKPVTALVLSHDHADHIADASLFVAAAKEAGHKLRIIASDATAEKMAYLNSSITKPTEVLKFSGGETQFESLTIQVKGFERASHTDDSSAWLLVEEKIIHAPDMNNPNQLPWLAFGGSENFVYMQKNFKQIAAMKWNIFSGGHGNIGWRKDLEFIQGYISDLQTAAIEANGKVSWDPYFNNDINNHAAMGKAWSEEAEAYVVNKLRPKYGQYYGFEASAPFQAAMALSAVESYQ